MSVCLMCNTHVNLKEGEFKKYGKDFCHIECLEELKQKISKERKVIASAYKGGH